MLSFGGFGPYFGAGASSASDIEAYFDGTFTGDFAASVANSDPDYRLLDLANPDSAWATQGLFFKLYGGLDYNSGSVSVLGQDEYFIVRGGAIV